MHQTRSEHVKPCQTTSEQVWSHQTMLEQVRLHQNRSYHSRPAQTTLDKLRPYQNMSDQARTLQSRSDHIQTSTNLTCSDVVQWCGLAWFDLFWNGPTWHGLTTHPPPSEIKLRGRVKVCEKYKMNKLPAEPLKVSIQNVSMPSESKIDKNINTLLGKIFEK